MAATPRRRRRALLFTISFTLLFAGLQGALPTAAQANAGGTHWTGLGPFEADDTYGPYDFDECGTTVTLSVGDRFGVRSRTTQFRDGSTLDETKGPFTADLSKADGGGRVEELNISGSTTYYTAVDGSSVSRFGSPTVVLAASPEEAEAYKNAGLPANFYFTKGAFVEYINADETRFVILQFPRDPVSICGLF